MKHGQPGLVAQTPSPKHGFVEAQAQVELLAVVGALGDVVGRCLGLGFRRSHSDNPGEACGSRSDLGFRGLPFEWGLGSRY